MSLVDVNDVANGSARAPDGRLWIIRDSDLGNLRMFDAKLIADRSRIGIAKVVRILDRAASAERSRGARGHWAYDQSHYRNVHSAARKERALLKSMGV